MKNQSNPCSPIAKIEDFLSVIFVSLMAVLPVMEVVLRKTTGQGIPFSSLIVQHATLWICYIGAAIASRKRELLCLVDLTSCFPESSKKIIKTFVATVGVTISLSMFFSGVELISAEYEWGKVLSFGVQAWVAELIIPIGYFTIASHFLLDRDLSWKDRGIVLIISIAILYAGSHEFFSESDWVWVVIGLLIIAAFFKIPIFLVLGGIAILLFLNDDTEVGAFAVEIYSKLAGNAVFPSLPLFTLAGYILAEGGASRRLVRFFQAMFGWIPGGIAVATIAVCAFFTTFTGASGVTILAMGGLLKPALDDRGYCDKTSVGIITGASSLGVLFPPSLPIIMYGVFALQPISDMFIGGLIPGVLLLVMTCIYGMHRGRIEVSKPVPFNTKEALSSLWEAKLEVFIPFFVLTTLFSGFATLVETAALTALYALVSEFIVHRDLRFRRDFARIISYSTVLIGGVLIILASAMGLTNYMIDAEVPALAMEFVTTYIDSPLVFLLFLNVFLLVAGCVMDSYTAIAVISPLLIPLGQEFNINPVHLGVIFLANLGVGYLTPPVGMNLFISSYRFKKQMPEIYKATFPIMIISLIGVLIITYFPSLTTYLLDLTGGATNVNIDMG